MMETFLSSPRNKSCTSFPAQRAFAMRSHSSSLRPSAKSHKNFWPPIPTCFVRLYSGSQSASSRPAISHLFIRSLICSYVRPLLPKLTFFLQTLLSPSSQWSLQVPPHPMISPSRRTGAIDQFPRPHRSPTRLRPAGTGSAGTGGPGSAGTRGPGPRPWSPGPRPWSPGTSSSLSSPAN